MEAANCPAMPSTILISDAMLNDIRFIHAIVGRTLCSRIFEPLSSR